VPVTVTQISSLIVTQIDDNPAAPVSVTPPASGPNTTPPEVLAAINEGQQLAVLLTLCLEITADFPLTTACWYLPRPVLTDLIVPLRFTLAGVRLRPSTLANLEAQNSAWQATAGTPARYAMLGVNLLAVTPQQTGNATASMTYAQAAAWLVNDTDVPAIPEAYHHSLVDYGVYKVRLKEGAQGLERGLKRFKLFLDDMGKLGDYVRGRAVAARYDTEPYEMALAQRTRLVEVARGG
jgi:hypothetical protein